jgi:hypothetical protein
MNAEKFVRVTVISTVGDRVLALIPVSRIASAECRPSAEFVMDSTLLWLRSGDELVKTRIADTFNDLCHFLNV